MRSALLLLFVAGTAHAAAPDEVQRTAQQLDKLLAESWRAAKTTPTAQVDDAGYLRRVYLDLTGTIPTAEQAMAFLADHTPDRRRKLVERLLDGPCYADHFTDYWDHLLMGRGGAGQQVDRAAFRDYLHGALDHDIPWPQLTTELLTATGENSAGGQPKNAKQLAPPPVGSSVPGPRVNGAVNWFLRYAQTPQDLAGKLARVFMGVQLQCAQCHNHPTEKWKKEEFTRLEAVFARVRPKPLDDKGAGFIRRIDLTDSKGPYFFGDPKDPDKQTIAATPPITLDGVDLSKADHRRVAFASWLTATKNPMLSRAIVNRMWAYFLGRGFVEPVDDFRSTNPITAPRVLDALTADFVAHGSDLKHLLRVICATRAYQLKAAPAKGSSAVTLWARYPLRPMGPEELFRALDAATHFDQVIERVGKGDPEKIRQQIRNALTFLFDVDEETAGEDFEGTMPQALLYLNGALINGAVSAYPSLALADVLALPGGDDMKITALYLRTLSRPPTPVELQHWMEYVLTDREVVETGPGRKHPKGASGGKGQKAGVVPDPLRRLANRARPPSASQQSYEDLFFALINSSEFNFRH